MIHDIWFVLRTLRNRPLFAVTTIGTLALGISAATTLFSAMNTLGRALPVPEFDGLARFFVRSGADDEQRVVVSYPEFEDLRDTGSRFSVSMSVAISSTSCARVQPSVDPSYQRSTGTPVDRRWS